MEIDIGIGKSGRQAFGFDDIAIVPSRRTRDPDDVDISWQLDAYKFDLPMMGSAMDSAISPETAVAIGKLGGLAVLNLEGLWSRYGDPVPCFEEIAELGDEKATRRMQEIYLEPVKPDLIGQRVEEMKSAGIVTAASLTPQRVREWAPKALEAGLDILVIQGTVVSAEHVSSREEPLNLKEYIAKSPVPVIAGGVASYSTALHLMRTGAVGVLVGVGPGAACTTRPGGRGAAGHRHCGCGRRAYPVFGRDRPICARHRRWRHADRWRRLQGHSLRGRRRDDRVPARIGVGGAREGIPLGDGHVPPDPAKRGPGQDRHEGIPRRDPRWPRS